MAQSGPINYAQHMLKPLSSVQHYDSFTGEENSPSLFTNLWNQTEKRTTPTSLASTSHNRSKIAFVSPFSRPNTDNVAAASFEKKTFNNAGLSMYDKKAPHYKSMSNLAEEESNRSSQMSNKPNDKLAQHNRSTNNLFQDETIKTSEIQYDQIDQTVSHYIESDNKIKDTKNLKAIRKTEENFRQCRSNKSNVDLPEIFSGRLISLEPSTKKEGGIFIGKIFLTSNASFQFLNTQLTYLEELVKDDHCEIRLINDKILVKLKWSGKITAKEVKAFIERALEKIIKFICLFNVLKFKMKGSQLSDFKTFSKGKMANIFVDYETNEVIAISAKSLKDLEALLKDLCLRYLQEDVAETNVEVFETFSSQYNENKSREKRDQVLKTNKPATIKSEIQYSNGKHLFLRRFLMKEFYANTKKNLDANFKLFPDKCVISGTQESIKRFEEFFNKIMMKIDETEVKLKFFGIQEFLQSNEGQNLLKSTESGNRCIIQLNSDAEPDTLLQQNTSQVAVTKTVSQNACDFGDIKVDVIVGEINMETTDVIVSSVTKHLNLRIGMLSNCILKTAGDIIQAELHLRYPMGINYGDFATSSGGNLPCKHIFHACIPYGYGRNSGEMTGLVIKMLEEADNIKAQSISIPALGTGALGYPLDASANEIFGGIRQFAQTHRQSLIQRVNIVIFPRDTETAQIFRSILFDKQDIGAESKHSEVPLTDPSYQSVESVEVQKISQEVDLKIFSDNAHKRQSAAKSLQEECQSAFKEENITDKNLHRLKPDQIKKLENIGLQHRIKVGIEGDQLNMQGFKSDGMLQVQKTKEKLILEAVGQHHQSLLSVIPSSIEWQYKLKDIWTTFKPVINSELEKAKKNSMYFEYTEDSGTKYNFDLFAMRVVMHTGIGKATYELRRYDKRKEGESLPNHWSAMTETENLKVVVIKPGTLEFITVELHFKQSGGRHQIKKIERIQNKSLHQQYAAKKREMDLYNPQGHQNEQNLFHGTSPQPIPQINETGFNRSYCGVNGTVYGKGVYFAVNASYSEKYAVRDEQGNKYMYRVKALTGEFIETNQETKYLPKKPGSNRPYDSGGNSSRGIYVIFHDAQVYPEYLITF
ncbi:poly [ADP-ribose] polymerase 14 [Biomphalaria glabrata]|nr:poly [ADP-ribose] polymerase 14 [Biomphalaria glabrata]